MRRGTSAAASLALAWVTLAPGAARAQVDAEIGGFAQANYAARITGASCPSGTACDFPLGEERLQLKLEAFSEDGSAAFAGKVDFFHDAVVNEPGIEVRETYLDLTSTHVAVRAGRQIITWGVGDLLFVNDVFPKDWVALFTGRPLQYLKVGSDALKVDLNTGVVDSELVLAPFFQPDRYPTGQRLVLPDPFPPGLPRTVDETERSFVNMELAGKLSAHIADWTVSAIGWRGRYRTPAMSLDNPAAPAEVRVFFPRLVTLGGTLSGAVLDGIVSVEGAHYDSLEDPSGTIAAIDNSQGRALLGYSRPLWEDATLGVQGYLEWMQHYDAYLASLPPGQPPRDERRWVATARFTQLLFHQTLTLNVFGLWGISDEDAYLIPSLRYAFVDELWAELGANIFLGEHEHTLFGMLDDNDNAYVTVRYGF